MANPTDDPAWLLMILIGVACLLGWLVWYFLHPQLLEAMRYWRMVEVMGISWFDPQARACLPWLREAGVDVVIPTRLQLLTAAQCFGVDSLRALPADVRMDYINLTMTSITAVTRRAMSFYRWGVLALALVGIYRVLFVSKRDSFKTRFDLESFIKIQAKVWPVITPIVKLNPTKHSARIPGQTIPDKLPLFAEALSPEEWLAFHAIPVLGGIPNKDRMRRALLSQLGPRWRGLERDLPPHMACLFAAFALKGVQKREESDNLLGRISLCWSPERGFRPTKDLMVEVKKIIADPKIGGEAFRKSKTFAYRTTAMIGILRWARFMGGVLASAQFLWLRGTDRDLWYALNNLGRRSFHSEGAGAIAHYMAEDVAGKALPIPRLDTAIIAMNKYLAANQPTIPPREEQARA